MVNMELTLIGMDVAKASELSGYSVPYLRKEIREQRLKAKKQGRRVTILRSDLEDYMRSLPDWTPGEAPAAAVDARRSHK